MANSGLYALLTAQAVARQLNVKVATLKAWRCRGGGPVFVKAGSLVRYKPEDVQAWIEERTVNHVSEN